MNTQRLPPGLTAILLLAACGTVSAAVGISAPSASVTIAHDGTNDNQPFAAQNWTVTSNERRGAFAIFSTNQAFRNTADSSYKRNVRLDLALVSSSGFWTVNAPSDQTNYAGGDESATVSAYSIDRGNATLALTVTFLTSQYDTLASGTYQLTVTGTVTAN